MKGSYKSETRSWSRIDAETRRECWAENKFARGSRVKSSYCVSKRITMSRLLWTSSSCTKDELRLKEPPSSTDNFVFCSSCCISPKFGSFLSSSGCWISSRSTSNTDSCDCSLTVMFFPASGSIFPSSLFSPLPWEKNLSSLLHHVMRFSVFGGFHGNSIAPKLS